MGKHAILAPSSAHRWLKCPGSIEAQRGIPSESSVFANEGTAAHQLAAVCLQQGVRPERFAGLWITTKGAFSQTRPLEVPLIEAFSVCPEMISGVKQYIAAVQDWTQRLHVGDDILCGYPQVHIEEPVILTPECWGTADCLIHQPGEHMAIIDFKYGKGYVDEHANHQLLTYALAAIQTHCPPNPARITLCIVQPRSHGPTTRDVTYTFAEFEALTAHWNVGIEAAMQTGAPRVAGEHCLYCKAESVCETLAELKSAALAVGHAAGATP